MSSIYVYKVGATREVESKVLTKTWIALEST